MHVLVGLLIVAVLAYVAYRMLAARPSPATDGEAPRSDRQFAYVANGLLFVRERDGEVRQVHSDYAQQAADRRERPRHRHGWKQGTSFGIAANGGMRSFDPVDRPIVATSAAWDREGGLLYFLKDEHVGGLFRREPESGREQRVLLRQNLALADLCLSAEGTRLAASMQHGDGIANIVLMNADGSELREVTGGDTIDTAPTWIPDAPKRLLFQSSGLARNAQGYIEAQGHASIQKLDLDTGSLSPILEDPAYDYLRPRVDPAGSLYYIRRPFALPTYGASKVLLDVLLFPFRLLRAVFHYLNFFSLMYSRKPLTGASGPEVQADMKQILLQGKRIDAEKALREARPVNGVPSLVPDDWILVRRSQAGEERVLATNVASFDLAPDGTVMYSNGRGVFVIEPDGRSSVAMSGELVGEVAAAGGRG